MVNWVYSRFNMTQILRKPPLPPPNFNFNTKSNDHLKWIEQQTRYGRDFFCPKFDCHQIVTIAFNLWYGTTRLTILQFLKSYPLCSSKSIFFYQWSVKLPPFRYYTSRLWLQALIIRLKSYIYGWASSTNSLNSTKYFSISKIF